MGVNDRFCGTEQYVTPKRVVRVHACVDRAHTDVLSEVCGKEVGGSTICVLERIHIFGIYQGFFRADSFMCAMRFRSILCKA